MRFRQALTMALGLALGSAAVAKAQAPVEVVRPEDQGMSSAKLDLITKAIQVNIETGQLPGAIVLVARNGKIVHLEAQGRAGGPTSQEMKVDTIFTLASLSKPITAVAVLMLVDEGKLRLDDPIGKFIPELGGVRQVRTLKPGSPPPSYSPLPFVLPSTADYGKASFTLSPATRPITVRDLLTHTSGIQIFGVDNEFPNPVPGDTLATRLPKLKAAPLEFQPGTRWAYSNGWGFDVLGRVVEVASGQPFNVFLKQRLFDPLGMKDTGFGPTAENASRALVGPGGQVMTSDKVTYFSGAAGLSSTVIDYAKFVQMLMDGGSANGHQFLKPETVKAMASNQIGWLQMDGYPPMAIPHEALRFGYGVTIIKTPAAGGTHLPAGSFGWDGVGTRRWWAVPSEHIVILSMANLFGPAAAPLQRLVEAATMSSIGK